MKASRRSCSAGTQTVSKGNKTKDGHLSLSQIWLELDGRFKTEAIGAGVLTVSLDRFRQEDGRSVREILQDAPTYEFP